MRIDIGEKGHVAILAENVKESAQLLAVFHGQEKVEVQKEVVDKRHLNHRNSWRGKHKVACPTCGKIKRNIKLHIRRMHPQLPSVASLVHDAEAHTNL